MEHRQQPMVLHLLQHIAYEALESTPSDYREAYAVLLDLLDHSEVGSEGCLQLSSVLSVLAMGFRKPPTEATRQAIEQGRKTKEDTGDFVIGEGDYSFVQLTMTPDSRTIEESLQRYVGALQCDGNAPCYIRLVKENLLEIVVQILWSI